MNRAPWASNHQLLQVGIQTRQPAADALPPSNLVFLIDNSGSMTLEMPLVIEALNLLSGRLGTFTR